MKKLNELPAASAVVVEKFITEAVKAVRDACNEFGRYNYHDKGADEVMEVQPWAKRLRAMTGGEAAVALNGVEAKLKDNAGPFITAMFLALQDAPDTWHDAVAEEATDKVMESFG